MNRDTLELELLLLRCRRGDQLASETLVRRFERPLLYYIRRMVQDEPTAWDALQKTWIRVFAGLSKPPPAEALRAWLFRIARNTALNHLRDERRHQASTEEPIEDQAEPNDSTTFDADCAEQIHAALDQLSLNDREALTLFFLEELTIREISDVLESPEGTIKSRLHFAKRRLRKILESHND